jgi:hypothetical protein
MLNWYTILYLLFAVISALLFSLGILFNILSNFGVIKYHSGYLTMELVGYVLLGLFTLMVIFLSVYKMIALNNGIFAHLFNIAPLFVMLTVIVYNIYLFILYRSYIVKGRVVSNYFWYDSCMLFIMILQIYIICTNLFNNMFQPADKTTNTFQTTGKITNISSSVFYLTGLFSIITAGNLFIILNYFKTDG